MTEPGPFVIGDGNAPARAVLDGIDDARMAEGGDVAVALQDGLFIVDAARDIDPQRQFQIDLQIRGTG